MTTPFDDIDVDQVMLDSLNITQQMMNLVKIFNNGGDVLSFNKQQRPSDPKDKIDIGAEIFADLSKTYMNHVTNFLLAEINLPYAVRLQCLQCAVNNLTTAVEDTMERIKNHALRFKSVDATPLKIEDRIRRDSIDRPDALIEMAATYCRLAIDAYPNMTSSPSSSRRPSKRAPRAPA